MAGSKKNLDSQIFQSIYFFFRNFQKFLKKFYNSSQFEKSNAKSLKIAKQLVFLHFWYLGTAKNYEKLAEKFENSSKTASFSFIFEWLAAENFWIHIFFRRNIFFNLKIFWNSSKFEKRNAKSLKIAAKHLVFHLGTAKSNEKLAENFENSSKTASFHPFLNGWQQKISGFEKFCEMFDFFRQFSNSSQFEKSNAKNLKIAAKQLVFLHFWYLGTTKSNEKPAEKFESSSKTTSFHPFLNGWQHKISGVTIFQKISDFFSNFIFLKKKLKKMKFVKIREKQRKKFENSSKTASFPPLFVPGNCQK